jgi:hypothetical protein
MEPRIITPMLIFSSDDNNTNLMVNNLLNWTGDIHAGIGVFQAAT